MTKKSNKKNKTKNNKNSNNTSSVNTDHDSKTKPSKISLNIFIEKDAPFLEDVLENINKLEKNNHNIKLNIYNGLTKYNQKYFSKILSNYSDIEFPNNFTKINKIIFDEIEFKFSGNNSAHSLIDSNEIQNITMSQVMYQRLMPLLDDEDELILEVHTENDTVYKINPDVYTTDGFINNKSKECDVIDLKDYKKSSLTKAIENNDDYYFYIDNLSFITDNNLLKNLIEKEKSIIGPKLGMAGGQPKSNFTLIESKSKYMVPILQDRLRNMWELKKIDNCFLIDLNKVNKEDITNVFDEDCKLDNIYCHNMTDSGWIICDEVKAEDRAHPELYQFNSNRIIWHRVYLDPVFYNYMEKNKKIDFVEPEECKDIFEWSCFTEKFCEHLIDECEKYGEWSTGGNKDTRLSSGYENVPTRDIHLKQIGLGEMWKEFVVNYFGKIAGDTFSKINTRGYNIAFVVRYTMDTQKELKPHHDASVHSTVTCLNKDFEGGGTHFLRQNYTHNPKKPGLTSIHPGRCTHYHSGKPITSGKRYILISFNE